MKQQHARIGWVAALALGALVGCGGEVVGNGAGTPVWSAEDNVLWRERGYINAAPLPGGECRGGFTREVYEFSTRTLRVQSCDATGRWREDRRATLTATDGAAMRAAVEALRAPSPAPQCVCCDGRITVYAFQNAAGVNRYYQLENICGGPAPMNNGANLDALFDRLRRP